jgi:hypothetical protein
LLLLETVNFKIYGQKLYSRSPSIQLQIRLLNNFTIVIVYRTASVTTVGGQVMLTNSSKRSWP